jgi:hypothetical protein
MWVLRHSLRTSISSIIWRDSLSEVPSMLMHLMAIRKSVSLCLALYTLPYALRATRCVI